jgi:hypothetical protein
MANDRARWKAERGLFDAWQYACQVMGHVQNGVFFEPDTGADLHDTVNGVEGAYYVSAVRYAGRAIRRRIEPQPGLVEKHQSFAVQRRLFGDKGFALRLDFRTVPLASDERLFL